MDTSESDKVTTSKKPGFWHIVLSTFAAAFGVQSNKNRERDFKHGHIAPYLVAGVLFTLVFVLVVAFTVNSVLKANGL